MKWSIGPGSLLVLLLLHAGSGARADTPPGCEIKRLARTFASDFLEGRHAQNLERMNETMRGAAGAEAYEQLRSSLKLQHGEVQRVGEAWIEDTVQDNLRLRVPIDFSNGTLDLQVVVDSGEKITGFFIQAHVEPPNEGNELEIRVGGEEDGLPGTLTLPAGEGPFPAVVLVHGSGGHDRDETAGPNKPFRDIAWRLAERGIATLRYDKRSYARPADLIAHGPQLTAQHEVIDDAQAALGLLRARPEIDAGRLYVVGHSLGGMLAPRIAEAVPQPAGIVVLAGPTLPFPEKLVEQTRYIVALDGEVTPGEQTHVDAVVQAMSSVRAALEGEGPEPSGYVMGAPLGYYRDLEAHDPPAQAAALGLPILVLQGERDYQVTMQDFAGWQRGLAEKPFACLKSYAALDHLFRSGSGTPGPDDYRRAAPVDPVVIEDIADWIASRDCP